MERLQKAMAAAGVASRRKCEELILAGRVKVNGLVVTELGTKVTAEDVITVDGLELKKENYVYYVLNKPLRVISSAKDEYGRKTAVEFIDTDCRVFPVGRLDYNSSGVLLLTNDGEFTNLMIHPRYEIEKEYAVIIKGHLEKEDAGKMLKGIRGIDGETYRAYRVEVRKYQDQLTYLRIILREGKNREIRKMMESLGFEVTSLHRLRFGCVTDKNLKFGAYRALKPFEIKQLKEMAQHGSE
ncbi:MAG: rRNA pseudouridine synthase [Erysipelotrichales bacterium]|nr:rRNA pseudouridine synthase [Erysipelotrichales bacterium]